MFYRYWLLFLLCTPATLFTQSDSRDYSEWLSVGVFMPRDSYDDLEYDQMVKLETKIVSIISKNGITSKISAFRLDLGVDSSSVLNNDNLLKFLGKGVVCIPKLEIYNSRNAETGMKNLHVVDANLTLTVQYIYEDIIFASETVQMQGSGNNKSQAVNSLIRNIKPGMAIWPRFLKQTHGEIIRYYESMCDKLMDQARQLDKLNETGKALAILWPIPKELQCHQTVEELSIKIYQRHINLQCKKWLLRARTKLAGNQYYDGLAILGEINPDSDCYDDALQMIKSIEEELDKIRETDQQLTIERSRQQLEIAKYQAQVVANQNLALLKTKLGK